MKSTVIIAGRRAGRNPARAAGPRNGRTNKRILIISLGRGRMGRTHRPPEEARVPHTRPHHFAPQLPDEFVGEILTRRQGGTETDFDLYRNTDTRALFVVGSVSRQTGRTLTNSHTRYTLGEFLAEDPGHRRRVEDVLRARAAVPGARP